VNSGDVKNTQASDLWKESQSMRAELRAEVADLRAKVSHSQIEIEERRKETLDLNRQYASCQAQLDDAKMHMASQQAVITDQVREIAMLRGLLRETRALLKEVQQKTGTVEKDVEATKREVSILTRAG
jgi:chromosome segregation ATPase